MKNNKKNKMYKQNNINIKNIAINNKKPKINNNLILNLYNKQKHWVQD